jgi:hypothetical protein
MILIFFDFHYVIYDVNSFGELHSVYLVWPIFVINNNISPWMSIKREDLSYI